MKIDVDNYDEECGYPCTPDGCMGHDTGIPYRISVNNFSLMLEDFAHGDWPFLDEEGAEILGEIERWKATVREIETKLTGSDARADLARKVLEAVSQEYPLNRLNTDIDTGYRKGLDDALATLRELFVKEGIDVD